MKDIKIVLKKKKKKSKNIAINVTKSPRKFGKVFFFKRESIRNFFSVVLMLGKFSLHKKNNVEMYIFGGVNLKMYFLTENFSRKTLSNVFLRDKFFKTFC